MSINYVGPEQLKVRLSKPHPRRQIKEMPTGTLPIFAVDPGGVTGWSLLVLKNPSNTKVFTWPQDAILENKVSWYHGQIDCREDESYGVYQLKKMLDDWPSAVVVVESFSVRQMAVDLSPVSVTAKLEDHLWYQGRNILKQSASQAKTTATDDRLKLWGCYTRDGGLNHARDADRHALLFMRRCMMDNKDELKAAAWPHIWSKNE